MTARHSFLPALTACALLAAGPAFASDVSDIAREMSLPTAVVEDAIAHVNAYYGSPDAPMNRMTIGVVKKLTLRAMRSRIGNLEDSTPGKMSEDSSDEYNGTYRAQIRTTRHDTSEASECVENRVTLTSSEATPSVRDGGFTFDSTHPRQTQYNWTATFCRIPGAGGTFGPWTLASGR